MIERKVTEILIHKKKKKRQLETLGSIRQIVCINNNAYYSKTAPIGPLLKKLQDRGSKYVKLKKHYS